MEIDDMLVIVCVLRYDWRGLMIDTGRRFVPLGTIENLLDTMAAVKLNVA